MFKRLLTVCAVSLALIPSTAWAFQPFDIPEPKDIETLHTALSFGKAPTEEEAQAGLKKMLRTVTAKYAWPPQKICWGTSSRWQLNHEFSSGWAVIVYPEGLGPYLVGFKDAKYSMQPGALAPSRLLWKIEKRNLWLSS